MLNEVDPAVNRSTANGSTTVFPYTFLIYDQAEIEVLCDTTVKTLTTDYTVSGVGVSGGGNITFVSAPTNGLIVTRMRKQPAAQQSDYVRNEAQPSERIEQDLDKLGMMVQQIKEALRRCLTFKKSSSQANLNIDEPTEGLFARWKTGGGIDWATPTNASPAALPISIANGGTGQTTAALARTALDVPSTGAVTAQIAAAASISDSIFRVVGSGDATKKMAFDVDSIIAGSTRTVTMPDADVDLTLVRAATTTNSGTSELATSAEVQAGTDTTRVPSVSSLRDGLIVLAGAAVATTSGTSVDISTTIPSWVKKITVTLSGVSTNGTSNLLLQIGPSGGVETASYGGGTYTPAAWVANSSGFLLTASNIAANLHSGIATLYLHDVATNTWVCGVNGGDAGTNAHSSGGGSKALAGVLTRVRLTTAGGADTFDAGSANLHYE